MIELGPRARHAGAHVVRFEIDEHLAGGHVVPRRDMHRADITRGLARDGHGRPTSHRPARAVDDRQRRLMSGRRRDVDRRTGGHLAVGFGRPARDEHRAQEERFSFQHRELRAAEPPEGFTSLAEDPSKRSSDPGARTPGFGGRRDRVSTGTARFLGHVAEDLLHAGPAPGPGWLVALAALHRTTHEDAPSRVGAIHGAEGSHNRPRR